MTDIADIAAFLTARLNEDDAFARACPPGPWRLDEDLGSDYGTSAEHDVRVDAADPEIGRAATIFFGPGAKAYGEDEVAPYRFVVRFDPARVLAEVAAKRRILARHRPLAVANPGAVYADGSNADACHGCGDAEWDRYPIPVGDCPELRDMAAVYADGPGYHESWRV